jgi:Cu(I)/Ag(I) efflux system membrane fusion protein
MRTIVAVFVFTLIAAAARADTRRFDAGMRPITAQYARIHEALAGDSTAGVQAAGKKIAALAGKLDARSVSGKHARHYAALPGKIGAAALGLSKARTLATQRAAFKELSRPLALWATMSRPAGINVVYCSMARGSWLQTERKIANPYYGARMLRCGEVVAGRDRGAAGGHMKNMKR